MPKRIAIVEDEHDLAENYRQALKREGYEVDVYPSRATAVEAFRRCLPDLAILDIQLGDEKDGGHQVCRELRQRSSVVPVMFLTALDDETDELVGLKLGANDYLSKQASLRMLVTRVQGLLAWHTAMMAVDVASANVIEKPPLHLDLDRMVVSWRDQQVRLSFSEIQVLACLVRHPGHVKSREQLMEAADKTIEPESVGSYIKRIRAAFRAVDADCNPVRTEYGVGYSWQGAAVK